MISRLSILLALLSITLLSCSNEEIKEVKKNEITVFTDFVKDVKSLENYKRHDAFKQISEIAKTEASKKIIITKSSIKSLLEEAKDYKFCIIFVADHTIVKVTDFYDCKQSGSWGACMPKGEGFVIKGKWNYKNDFINNIISLADNQSRVAYLYK